MTIKKFIEKVEKKGCKVKVNNVAKAKNIYKVNSRVVVEKSVSFSKLIGC